MQDVLFSSKTDQWATPQAFFDELNREFHFDLDPCADDTNHKTPEYFTREQDGLKMDWGGTAYFATRRMVERLKTGLQSATTKHTKKIRWLCC